VLPPLSPISEYVASEEGNVCQSSQPTPLCQTQNSSGTSTRSVSAAVSDESVAGDSGVFEASNNHHHRCESQQVNEMDGEAAQVQVKLRYVPKSKREMVFPHFFSLIGVGFFSYNHFYFGLSQVFRERLYSPCWN